ncbi:MAG: ParA family protein [Bacteroidota bacterium]
MIIAFTNHKGGTGKTTSVANIGTILHSKGKSVLFIDCDPQGNLSYSLGASDFKYGVSDVLLNKVELSDAAIEIKANLYILPSDIKSYKSESQLYSQKNGEFLLKEILKNYVDDVDYILIDCPPSLSIYTKNALNAANSVIIPMQLDVLSLQGLEQMTSILSEIINSTNPNLTVTGVLGVNVNESRKLSSEILEHIRENYDLPIFNNYIRASVKVAEAPSFAKSVVEYAPESSSAKDYKSVTNELLKITENKKK